MARLTESRPTSKPRERKMNDRNERKPENLLLAALPQQERDRLEPFLHWVPMENGQSITIPEEPIRNLYFPYDAVTSTVQEMSDGSTIETGLMGIEGLAGVQVWLHQRSTAASTFVQVPGMRHRISTEDFNREYAIGCHP